MTLNDMNPAWTAEIAGHPAFWVLTACGLLAFLFGGLWLSGKSRRVQTL